MLILRRKESHYHSCKTDKQQAEKVKGRAWKHRERSNASASTRLTISRGTSIVTRTIREPIDCARWLRTKCTLARTCVYVCGRVCVRMNEPGKGAPCCLAAPHCASELGEIRIETRPPVSFTRPVPILSFRESTIYLFYSWRKKYSKWLWPSSNSIEGNTIRESTLLRCSHL